MKLLVWLVAMAAFGQDPNAVELLARSGGSALTAGTVRMAGTRVQETLSPPGAAPVRSSFSFSVAPGGRFRRAVTTGEALQLDVSDGASTWSYSTPANTWSKRPAGRPLGMQELAMLRYGRERANLLTAVVKREDSLDFGGRLTACSVVRASYRGVPWAPDAREVLRTVWIAKGSDLVLRDTWEVTVAMPFSTTETRGRQAVEFSSIEWDGAVAADQFLFTPPEGSRPAAPPLAGTGGSSPLAKVNPVVTRRVEAESTPEARAAGYQGTVGLYVEVTPEGKAANVQVLQGLGLGLDERAIEAVRQWQFTPGMRNGQPERMAISADVSFDGAAGGVWRVNRAEYMVQTDRSKGEALDKPVLTRYESPSGACPTGGARLQVSLEVGEKGIPRNVRVGEGVNGEAASAARQAVEAWRYQPGRANGRARAAQARLEMECGFPAPAQESVSMRIGNGVTPPTIAFKTEPEYSEAARRTKYQGSLQLEVVVDATGHTAKIVIPRMLGLGLDQKAMEAVKTWRFKPGMKDGHPVSVFATIEVNFRLL